MTTASRALGSAFAGLTRTPATTTLHSPCGSSALLRHWQWSRASRARRFSSGRAARISMSLRAGIVGLPNVGKSTLFNAIVENGKAQAANFPFCTISPNVGVVAIPDPRLQVLSKLSKSQQTVPTSIELVDIAGLVKGASKGEGLGNQFLSNIREVDSILQVVRCFEDDDIVHVNGKVDPRSDIDVINLELIFSDLEQIEKRLDKLKKSKTKDTQVKVKEQAEKTGLEKIQEALMDGRPARSVDLADHEKEAIQHLCLLTMKPVIYVANVTESDLAEPDSNPHVKEVAKAASDLQSGMVTISAQVEAELAELPLEERVEYLKSLGVAESGLGNLVQFPRPLTQTFNCVYFYQETKAWTILSGMTAPQAAGVIHSDFQKGFIRAETVSYDDFVAAGSLGAAREKGLLRLEGKDYVVQEGDVMLFRFNV
ncbi:ribosome-binding ATPase YchF [Panicum miliaceum]|uniref:Obg-like ATPase 1 n=1 Tax=Panicum miliaceum TaxID=4540 RepID=A0A3L6SCT5_PANMI|nr:ribosome-binding ATPase YchF [Panicum miliaceum]